MTVLEAIKVFQVKAFLAIFLVENKMFSSEILKSLFGKLLQDFLTIIVIALKVQSRKLCNNKNMIASTQIKSIEIFAFIAGLVFKLLSRKVLFINRKDNRNYEKVGYLLRKLQILRVNFCKITNSWNAKFSGYF